MKHKLIWFFEAASHYITLWLLKFHSRNNDVIFLCGAPRSGTSWVSDVLSYYFNLPRPKHYRLPILFDAVVHTHVMLNPEKYKKTYFVIRDGRNSYLSYYYMLRKDILSEKNFVKRSHYLKIFKDVKDEANISYNVLVLMKDDMKQHDSIFKSTKKILDYQKAGVAPVIVYEEAQADPMGVFSKAIRFYSGDCDMERLEKVLNLQSKKAQRKMPQNRRSTTINSSSSDWTKIFDEETIAFYEKHSSIQNNLPVE